jgi:RimJ/RimL family protein N-acetyltransferase
MKIVPYQAEHLLALQLQPGQAYCAPLVTEEYARALESQYAFTAMADDVPVGVGGVAELWSNRALLWSFIDKRAGRHFIGVHRATQRFLDLLPYKRIEAECDCEFGAGHRWLQKLGFVLEAPRMKAFRVDGGDAALYARVKHG